MENQEIRFDIYCDDTIALTAVLENHKDVELEIASGLGGLEIAGTLLIPSLALALKVLSLMRELKKKEHPSIVFVKVHIHIGHNVVILRNPRPEEIEKTLIELENDGPL